MKGPGLGVRSSRWLALVSYLGLILYLFAHIVFNESVTPRPIRLIVVVGPLLIPLLGILRASPRAHLWASLLALTYGMIGFSDLLTVTPDSPLDPVRAATQTLLATVFFVAAMVYTRGVARATKQPARAADEAGSPPSEPG